MKNFTFYKKALNCKNKNEVFNYLLSTLKPSNMLWSYFVNWDKVFKNTKGIELALNTLNYLIGKENFDDEFRFIITKNPDLVKVIPALAVRTQKSTKKFKILVQYDKKRLVYEDFDFSKNNITKSAIEKCLAFVTKTGLKKLIASKKIKNLVDYMIGVEAGLDSNGRKNRSGDAMEDIVDVFISDLCRRKRYSYIKEANAKKIKNEMGYEVPVDKSSRRYDFVIDNNKEPILIETNFYGGGGSKVKSTAGEYRNLFDTLKGKYKFIWITDGMGWKKTSKPLRETFNHNNYLFNLNMLEKGILHSFFA